MKGSTQVEVERLLRDARALIARPWAWFKGDFYYLRFVKTKGSASKAVDCYCAVGALQKAAGVPLGASRVQSTPAYIEALRRLEDAVWHRSSASSLTAYNDRRTTTKKDILGVFDAAIASLEN